MGTRHEDEHLRRFCAARDGGDRTAMLRWWEEVVIDFYDRMDGLVAGVHKGQLRAGAEHDEAVERALIKFAVRLRETFDGHTMGQLVNATKTLAFGVCVDVQREVVKRKEREGRSLDGGWDADAEDRESTRWEADEAAFRFARDEEAADAADVVEAALAQVQEDRRAVLERDRLGIPVEEIMAELGLSKDNVYKLRSRGMKDLRTLMEGHDA